MQSPPIPPRGHVLIVDDDAGVRDVCATLLQVLGYGSREVHDGEQALEALGQPGAGVELVLLDLQMPRMDGECVLRELKRNHPGLPVLLMSGRPRGDLAQFLSEGASAVLKKPFGLSELDNSLENALGTRMTPPLVDVQVLRREGAASAVRRFAEAPAGPC